MQFTTTLFALVATLAASASAQYPQGNATIPAVSAGPIGTGSAGGAGGSSGNGSSTLTTPSNPGATGFTPPTQWGNGAVGRYYAGSGLGLLVAGGVAFAL